jgi:hypothetical protein
LSVYTPISLSIAHCTLPFYQPMDHHQIVLEHFACSEKRTINSLMNSNAQATITEFFFATSLSQRA